MFSHSSAQETSKAFQDNLSLHSAPSRCYQWGLKPCQLKRFEHQSTTNILLWSPASWGKYVRTKGGSWKTQGIIVAYWHLQQDFPVPFHSVTYKMGVSPCSLPPRFISLLEVILLASGWLHGSHVSFPEVYSLTSPPRRWLPLAKRFGSSQQPLLMSSQNGSSKNPDCHWFCPVVFFVLNDSLSTLSLMPSAGTSRTLFCRATSVKTLFFFCLYLLVSPTMPPCCNQSADSSWDLFLGCGARGWCFALCWLKGAAFFRLRNGIMPTPAVFCQSSHTVPNGFFCLFKCLNP